MKRLLFILATLLLSWGSVALADQTLYCRAGCTYDGDGSADSCAASGGAAGAFNDWANCLAGAEAATTAVTEDLIMKLNDDAGTNFLASVNNSLTIDQDFDNIIWEPASGAEHSGTFDESLPVIECSSSGVYPFYINTPGVNFIIRGLQFKHTNTGSRYSIYVHSAANTQDITIDRVIVDGNDYNNSNFPFFMYFRNASATLIIKNSIFFDLTSSGGVGGALWWRADATAYIYNNTIHNSENVIYGHGGVATTNLHVSNNIAQDLITCFYDNNQSDDFHTDSDYNWTNTNCTTPDDDSLGANATKNDNTIVFDDKAGDDFHVTGESATLCAANNQYAHSPAAVTTDLDNEARPSTGDEYLGADTDTADTCAGGGGGGIEIFRRRREGI